MADRMLKLVAARKGSTALLLGTAPYEWMSGGIDAATFGTPKIQPRLSDADETDEFMRLGDSAQVRTFPLELNLAEATTEALEARVLELLDVVAEINKWGGKIRYRAQGMTYPVELLPIDIDVDDSHGVYSHESDLYFRQTIILQFTVQPWAYADPLSVVDRFTTDTLGTGGKYNDGGADWTSVASIATGAAAITNWAISAGRLDAVANLATEYRIIHTGTKWKYADPWVAINAFRGGSTTTGFTNQKVGVIVKWIDKDNYIEAYTDYVGGQFRKRIDVILAGVRTNRVNATGWTVGKGFRVGAGMKGNRVYISVTADNRIPAETAQRDYTLTTAEAAALGLGIRGRCGFVAAAQDSETDIREFEAQDGFLHANDVSGPITQWQSLPSPTAASTTFELATYGLLQSTLFGWWNRPRSYNLLPAWFNGGPTATNAWVHTAVAGLQPNAGTSIANTLDTSTLHQNAQAPGVVVGTSAGAGANHPLLGRVYEAGVTYRFKCKVKLQSGAGTVRAVMGNGAAADIASGTAIALTSSYQAITVDWTPTANRFGAHVAVITTTTTACSWSIVEWSCYEVGTAPEPALGAGGHLCYGVIGGLGRVASTNFASTVDGTAWYGGPHMRTSTVGTSTITFPICSDAIDEPDGEAMVDVFACLSLTSTVTGCTIKAAWDSYGQYNNAKSSGGNLEPFSSTPKAVTPPSSGTARRMVYVGRYTIPTGEATAQFELTFSVALTAGTVGFEYAVCVPAKRSIQTPSGTAPEVNPFTPLPMTIKPDLEVINERVGFGQSRYGGSALLLDSEQHIESIFHESNVPIDGVSLTTETVAMSNSQQSHYRARIQPRHYLLEGSTA